MAQDTEWARQNGEGGVDTLQAFKNLGMQSK